MVIICDMPFNECSAQMFDGKQLSDFQKWAIKAIVEGDNVLITAHTGSGKTLPAEFAIQYFTQQGKKVIYASPIKALSNQKLYDFRRKFPTISFGILTGDCKDNPEADVLIMTTEILRNALLNKKISGKEGSFEMGSFEMGSFEMGNLAAVIFDEVHYINDAERGSVWEQAILLLPLHIQLIMLSATIDRPEEFAGWVEGRGKPPQTPVVIEPTPDVMEPTPNIVDHLSHTLSISGVRGVSPRMYLIPTYTRVVPLTHYMWLSVHEGSIKKAAKTPYENKLETLRKTPIMIATPDGIFREDNYYKVKEVKDYLQKNNVYAKRQFVLEELLKYLQQKEMLPAICFVFSRKHVELAAREISFSLFEADSGLPALVEKECRHILQSKLANYQEYLELPEYLTIVRLLEKGIAIHHAGIIPVLREMVELLFEKGFIRLLIATETFAVGLNMPTKTVIFAGLTKYNGNTMRQLFPHEYTQMAGRAGRRGIDTVGHVIHCVNLFDMPTATEYKHLLTGPPQYLTSKFKIGYTMALAMIDVKKDITEFMSQSLLTVDIQKELRGYVNEEANAITLVQKKKEQLELCRTPIAVLENYRLLSEQVVTLTNSARKKMRIEMNSVEAEYKFLVPDMAKLEAWYAAQHMQGLALKDKNNTGGYIANTINQINQLLLKNGFICDASIGDASIGDASIGDASIGDAITEKGKIAALLQEVHPLAMADLYMNTSKFAALSAIQLAGLFAAFYPVSVNDEFKMHSAKDCPALPALEALLHQYHREETAAFIESGSTYQLYYDLIPYVMRWCQSADETACRATITDLKEYTGVFLGEFIKALLKVNAVAAEFEGICELTQNISLLEKLREIPRLTLKYIATNQSLYL